MCISRIAILSVVLLAITACEQSGPTEERLPAQQTLEKNTLPADDLRACSLVMGWDPWEPYQYEISNHTVIGLDVDVLRAVVNHAGCEISFHRDNWEQLLRMLNKGEIDLLAGATRTASREEYAYFTDVYRDEEFYLYVAKDRLQEIADKRFEDLMENQFRIAVIGGYLYGEQVSKYQDDTRYLDQFTESSMSEINISLLLDGQVDGFIEDKFVGAAIIRRKNLADAITPHSLRFDRNGVHIMISRATVDEPLFLKLNQGLQAMLASGEIQNILAPYQNQ